MSKLDELLEALCPDGVEYKAIGDVVKYEQPTFYIVSSTDYRDDSSIPVLTAGQSFILGYTGENEGIYNASEENPVIIFDDFTGAFKWVNFPFKVKSSAMKILKADENEIMMRYAFHVMGNIGLVSDEHKRLWISQYSAIRIPVPPMPVQREIVHILDKFTKLIAELKVELMARKKQYEYSRNTMLAVDNRIHMVKLKDIAKSTAYVGNEKCLAGGDIVVMNHKQNPKYLSYVLSTYDARQQNSKAVHSTVPSIDNIEIPLPSLEVQERYVNVLDNFESICASLNIGLPAEIELRKKQNEFYRDALLIFAETGNIIAQADRQNLIKLLQYVFGFVCLELNEVTNTFRGEYITKKDTRIGNIPVILGGQEPAYYIDRYNHEGEIVVIARSGASAGFVSYWNEPIFLTDGFGFEAKTEMITTRYLYHALKNVEADLNAMKRGAGVPHVSGEKLGRCILPVPSISEQNRIVSMLDRFDSLCNDLSNGIPAEIEARRKQYEYYRDKLLLFEKKI